VTAATPPAPGARRWDTPLLILAVGVVVVIALGILPTLLLEQTRDWIAYQQAADRLASGQQLYVWVLPTPDDEYYLYPPGMAAAWLAFGNPAGFLLVKVGALLAAASLAPIVAGPAGRTGRVALLLAAGSIVWPPNMYDLILGNVMALYVGAAAVVIARRGWLGAGPLGVVLALAAKPAAIPLLIWLAVRRPRDAVRVVVWAAAVSALIAIWIGPGRYLEYLGAIPKLATVATDFTGNVGLVTISPAVALIGIGVAWLAAAVAGLALPEAEGAAVALGAMLLAQPTIGFNYAGLLFPALALLCSRDRRVGLGAFAVVTPLMVVSTVGAAAVVVATGFAAGRRR
jgi:hypothetical protein